MCMTCRKLHHHTMEQMVLPPRDKSPPFTCPSVDTFGLYFLLVEIYMRYTVILMSCAHRSFTFINCEPLLGLTEDLSQLREK